MYRETSAQKTLRERERETQRQTYRERDEGSERESVKKGEQILS